MNRTREVGNRDEVEGFVTNTLNLLRNGASLLAKAFGVGFIDWLDGRRGKQERLTHVIIEMGMALCRRLRHIRK
jgi:ABC-type uncharacterized transport system permease subunit